MKPHARILPPLLVMLLLTLLVGATAWHQMRGMERATGHVNDYVSEQVILNNIKWQARQLGAQPSNTDEAARIWREMQTQARLLAGLRGVETLSVPIRRLLTSPSPDLELLESLDHMTEAQSVQSIVARLDSLHGQAEANTLNVTLGMALLGLLLMTLTARDLGRLFSALARSRDMNMAVQEDERRRIAQELHDGVIQDLIALKRDYAPGKVDGIVENLRRVCNNLKPQVLDDLGLAAALGYLADDLRRQTALNVQLHLDAEELGHLPKAYELPIFRVAQELFANIRQHAHATAVSLILTYEPSQSPILRGVVRDNGCGFNLAQSHLPDHLGLTGVEERIRQLGGTLSINSAPQAGSTFEFKIPVRIHEPA